jgi:hypothetical protein
MEWSEHVLQENIHNTAPNIEAIRVISQVGKVVKQAYFEQLFKIIVGWIDGSNQQQDGVDLLVTGLMDVRL